MRSILSRPSIASRQSLLRSGSGHAFFHKGRLLRAIGTHSSNSSPTLSSPKSNEASLWGSDSRYVKINIKGNSVHEEYVDLLYLRDSCSCSLCVNPSTRQKLFETSGLPLNIAARELKRLPDGGLEVCWENDIHCAGTHRSVFSRDFMEQLQSMGSRVLASHNSWKHVAWDQATLEKYLGSLRFQYEEYMKLDESLYTFINRLHEYGLVFVESVPKHEDAVKALAQRIGPIKHTFYGETWDVKSQSSPINVAYTAEDLDFHMDLLYLADPPGIQLLHCIKQSNSGGESRFSDGVLALDKLQTEYPELVRPLVYFPVTYRYKNNGHWFQKTRTFLEGGVNVTSEGKKNNVNLKYQYPTDYESINWSPPFQGPLEQVDPSGMKEDQVSLRDYVKAASTFKKLLAHHSAVFETKLDEGTCVVFNNRRILHARRPFDSEGGERWLKGCYVDGDYLRDRYRVCLEG